MVRSPSKPFNAAGAGSIEKRGGVRLVILDGATFPRLSL
jgi:hypothetical protein